MNFSNFKFYKNVRMFVKLCALGLAACATALAQTPPLVIEGGTLIDGTGGAAMPNSVIVVEGARIKAVGTRGGIAYPKNAKVVKADGKTVLPGFIDGHIHFTAWMPPLFLHYGVTTVYDTANPTDWILAQRDAINKGRIKGPRIFATGIVIDGPESRTNMNHPAEKGGYRVHVHSAEEAKTMVRQLVSQGVDAIKVHEGLTTELLKAVVEEAHAHGLEAIGHTINARDSANVGFKFIEHTWPVANATLTDPAKLKEMEEHNIEGTEYLMKPELYDPLIQLLAQKGIYFNPTFAGNRYWTRVASPQSKEWADTVAKVYDDPGVAFVPDEERQAWLRAAPGKGKMDPKQAEQQALGLKNVMEFIRRYAAAGGKFVAGPDTGGYDHAMIPGLALHFEMQSLMDAGLTPMQAILSVTKWPAELLHKEKDLGTLEAGKIADFIVVNGDPLANLSATRNIELVVKEGKIVDTAFDPKFANPLPRTIYADPATEGPEISSLAPKAAREGDRDLTLQIAGKHFHKDSVVRFDNSDLPTQFVSEAKLTATVGAARFRKFGSYAVTVVNPGSGGGTSVPLYFLVNFKD